MSLHLVLVQDAQDHQAIPSVSAERGTENSAPIDSLRPAHRRSRTISDFGGIHYIDGTKVRNAPLHSCLHVHLRIVCMHSRDR